MEDVNIAFWKFWCHHDLVRSGRVSILLVIGESGLVRNLAGRIAYGYRKWTYGHLWIMVAVRRGVTC